MKSDYTLEGVGQRFNVTRRMSRTAVALVAGAAVLLSGCAFLQLPGKVAEWQQLMSPEEVIPAEPLSFDAADGFLMDATIDGHPVRLRVSLRSKGIELNPETARRIGLESRGRSTAMQLGKKMVDGGYAQAEVLIGTARSYPRVEWFDADVGDGVDGVINIAYLPAPSVTLNLRPRREADRPTILPTVDRGGFAVVYRHREGNRTIDVRPDLASSQTVLTTATGAYLAERLGGTWSGTDRPHPIVYGIARPVRPMAFATPLIIGNFRIDEALVRLRDYQGDDLLPSFDTGEDDEDTIMVVGDEDRTAAVHFLYLGRDVLGRCASITYTRASQELELICPPPPDR
tara:strand:- start:483 stop:1514 length:1032 start_codon:yes stop_codon:yes gene_type:complete